MGAGHSWPRGIATGRGDFSGETLCSTESAYQRGFSGPTGDRSRRTPHVARGVLTARLSENVVPKRFGVFISTSIIATYIFEVLKTSFRYEQTIFLRTLKVDAQKCISGSTYWRS